MPHADEHDEQCVSLRPPTARPSFSWIICTLNKLWNTFANDTRRARARLSLPMSGSSLILSFIFPLAKAKDSRLWRIYSLTREPLVNLNFRMTESTLSVSLFKGLHCQKNVHFYTLLENFHMYRYMFTFCLSKCAHYIPIYSDMRWQLLRPNFAA